MEFEPGIISVVGPNGSGKSNIADSLRWVFGEQSMKLLRGKKAEDVIFAGSEQKARLGSAEVAVYFDNSDRQMAVDYSEVVIARRVFRDGNSEYSLNGNVVRLLDIEELLAKSGFGNTSYHVIGQGMIDQLILRGPAAVKELIEEASGIKPYYVKRERTIRRLEHTESNLEQAQVLLQEIEPRLRSLKRQTKKLERRTDLEQELREAQIAYFGQLWRSINTQLHEVSSKLGMFTSQIAQVNREIANLSHDTETQEQNSVGEKTVYLKLRSDLNELQQQKNQIQEELAIIRGKLKVEKGRVGTGRNIALPELRGKFRTAFGKLKILLKNFTLQGAAEVEKLFAEISTMIESSDTESEEGFYQTELGVLLDEEKRLNKALENMFSRIKNLEKDLANYIEREDEIKQQLFVKERLLRNKQDSLLKISETKNLLAVEEARLQTRKEAYEQEAESALGKNFAELFAQAISAIATPSVLLEKIANLKKQLESIGGVDDLLLQEYHETSQRHEYLSTQSTDLEKGVRDLKAVMAELDEIIKKEFHAAFSSIEAKFGEYFRILFGGGRATMSLLREQPTLVAPGQETEEEPDLSADLPAVRQERAKAEIVGIEIKATPPGKKLAGIAALSGGERALTSIALLCAILATYPSPFVVLDEVDAALDEANSIRFGKILGSLANKTQFITITHNRETMRQSHTLYGVTMGEDSVSRVLSLKLEQAAAYSTKV